MSHPKPTPHTEEEIQFIKDGFSKLPTYKNGYVDYPDYHKLIKELHKWDLSDESIDVLIELWKSSKNGTIHWDELERYLRTCHDTVIYAGEIVKQFDMDKNGYISTDEFGKIFTFLKVYDPKLNEVSFETFTQEADLNHDGRVSMEEAQAWVEKKLKH